MGSENSNFLVAVISKHTAFKARLNHRKIHSRAIYHIQFSLLYFKSTLT